MSATIIPFEAKPPIYFKALRIYRKGGLKRAASTGWPNVDELFTVATGQWTVITGTPGSGKSEWLDAMLVNLAEKEPWLFAIYSPENFPTETHLIKLVEKRIRKPFGEGPTQRMTEQEFADGAQWVLDHFLWLSSDFKTPDELLTLATEFERDGRKLAVVLDPWNALDHQRAGMTETDYVSFILTEVTKLARGGDAHIFLVVHPAKMQRNRDGTRPIPSPYDIAGSAHWYNKADNIITVHRDQVERYSQKVDIYVQKVRFKHLGHVGQATLLYDRITGRYFEAPPHVVNGDTYADPERGNSPPTLNEQNAIDAQTSAAESEAEREALQAQDTPD